MEILINDIPEEGLEIAATEKDPWCGGLVREVLGEIFMAGGHVRLRVDIHRIEGNVNIAGRIDIASRQTCDRCLADYEESLSIPLSAVLAPLYESERQRKIEEGMGADLVKEDLEFGYYEGDRFDLSEVVREQMILAQPMKHLCRKDCAGLCQRCGKNLNDGPCGCRKEAADPRWAPLKDLKIAGKK